MIELNLSTISNEDLPKKIYEISERMNLAPPNLRGQMSTLLRAYQAEFAARQQQESKS